MCVFAVCACLCMWDNNKHIKLDWNVKHWLLHDFLSVFWLIIVNMGATKIETVIFVANEKKSGKETEVKAKMWIIMIFEIALRI